MSFALRYPWLVFIMVISLCLCSPGIVAFETGYASYCSVCASKGFIACPECKGKGTSNRVDVKCKKCDGTGKIKCKHCDEEGLIRCPKKCRKIKAMPKTKETGKENKKETKKGSEKKGEKKEGDGEDSLVGKYVVPNPAYSKLYKRLKHGSKKQKEQLEKLARYIICSACKGTGRIKCRACKGSRELVCHSCRGKKTVKGVGMCPRCKGKKILPCPKCATLVKGADAKVVKSLVALEKLYKDKLLAKGSEKNEKLYWQQRRKLVRQGNKGLNDVSETGSGAGELQAAGTGGKKEKVVKKSNKGITGKRRKKIKQELKKIIQAYNTGAISLQIYQQRCAESGLSRKELFDLESASEAGNKIRNYLDLKQTFRRGEIDYDEFRRRLEKLR